MHNSAWIAFLRQLPPSIHNTLSIITRIGQELSVQNIFRMEPDYVVLRGRMSGTTDEGRVFILPYDEMHAVGFQKPMKEHEIEAILSGRDPGKTAEPGAVEAENVEPAAEAPPAPAPKPPEPTPLPSALSTSQSKAEPPSKILLLERVLPAWPQRVKPERQEHRKLMAVRHGVAATQGSRYRHPYGYSYTTRD